MSPSGSLYQRPDGCRVASIKLNGKTIVKYGKTKREAQQRLAEMTTAATNATLTRTINTRPSSCCSSPPGSGLGEALGLTWGDIELQTRTVSVRRTYVFAGEAGSIQSPKSRADRRAVGIHQAGILALQRLPRALDGSTAVFATAKGTAPSQSNHLRDLHQLCAAAGVPAIPIHGLRHVHAALLAAEGVDTKALQRRLGHARISTTLDVYAYAITPDAVAVEAFDRSTGTGRAGDDYGAGNRPQPAIGRIGSVASSPSSWEPAEPDHGPTWSW